jgi:hypothetical protein
MSWYNPISWFTDPANEQKAGYRQAATDYGNIGAGAKNDFGYLSKKANSQFDPAWAAYKAQQGNRPGQQQNYFDQLGAYANGPTDTETLYNERKSGNDPAAAYEDQRAIAAINNQLAARGGYNSGAGTRLISDYLANAGAQRSQQLAGLAGAADQSRLGLENAYGSAAAGASGEESKYFGDLTNEATTIGGKQAGITSELGTAGIQANTEGKIAAVQAQLAAAGVDAQTIQAITNNLLAAAKTGAAIAAAA